LKSEEQVSQAFSRQLVSFFTSRYGTIDLTISASKSVVFIVTLTSQTFGIIALRRIHHHGLSILDFFLFVVEVDVFGSSRIKSR
jgi:hypothetical protein